MPGGKITLGTRGEDGQSLVRDLDNFKKNLEDIDFTKRKPGSGPKKVIKRAGKTTYTF